MQRLALTSIQLWDRLARAAFLAHWREQIRVTGDVSPNLRFVRVRMDPGARLEIGADFFTERQRGNRIWIQRDATVALGARCWLRTEHGENQLTAFEGARISIGPDALLNGVMLHAKRSISIGSDVRMGFGSRVLDADLHDIDRDTRERIAPVSIGDRVWLGADVRVLRGVTIGDDVVVGAGSVVTRDLPSRCLAAGSPARVIREIASREGCR